MNQTPFTRRDFVRFLTAATAGMAVSQTTLQATATKRPPNVVLILSDDIGYGDVGCYGASVVHTPNIDKLAAGGLRFTDAHTDAATCTPSRYAIMTGTYAWRKDGARVLPGDARLLLNPAKPSLASIFKQKGYTTGCIGKWHLGLGNGTIDWNGTIAPGPLEVGFDTSFIIPATADRVPCVYVEDHHVAGLDPNDPITVSYKQKVGSEPTGRENPDLLTKMKLSEGHDGTIVDGVSRIGYMTGGKSALWVDEEMAQTITHKAQSFIENNQHHPFFLYFATSDIHVPHMPNGEFHGTSACGLRCDSIEQLDWTVGQILATLDKLNLREDTLVIFTSDNGPVVDDGYADGSVEHLNGHTPADGLRGGKYSIYEGGTRVPFVVSWPGTIRPGTSDALVSQVDLLASFAAMINTSLPPDTTRDSEDVLPALLGKTKRARTILVEEATVIAIRQGKWKLIDRAQKIGKPPAQGTAQDYEFYDLSTDIAEKNNVAAQHPKLAHDLASQLAAIRNRGMVS